MVRELTLQVMKIKKSLYSKLADIEKKKEDIANHFFSSDVETEEEFQEKPFKTGLEESEAKAAVERAQLFSLRHSDSLPPFCIFCFVEHDDLHQLEEIEPKFSPTKFYQCDRCGQELKIDTI